MEHSVLAISCRALLAACSELGVDCTQLLRAAAVDQTVMDDPDGRLTPVQVQAMWQGAYDASNDPLLSLHVSEKVPKGAYRVLEYVIRSASTVGAAFEKISEYFAWIDTSATLPISRQGEFWALGVDAGCPPQLVPRQAMEFTFGVSLRKVREESGLAIIPREIHMACPAAPSLDDYQNEALRVLQCPVQFDAPDNALLFDDETWNSPLPTADASLLSVFEQHAQELLDSVTQQSPLARDMRRALSEGGPSQTIDEVARRLAVSGRTLQRRLHAEQLVYADLVAEFREQTARQLLTQRKVSVAEIAFLLGFSDQSSFTRAFRRWTGETPAAFRRAKA